MRIVGAKAQRRVQIAGVAEHSVVVTSYDLMRRDIDEYVEQDFARVVLDEASTLKTRSRRWRAPQSACLPACALP